MVNIVNLAPHPVVVLRDDTEGPITGFTGVGPASVEGRFSLVATFAPSGKVARARQTDEKVGELDINGVPVPLIEVKFGEPSELPAPEEGTYYVLSVITAQAAKAAGRSTSDLLVTSDPVRDATGRFIGVRKFALI